MHFRCVRCWRMSHLTMEWMKLWNIWPHYYTLYGSCLPVCGIAIGRSLSFWFHEKFEENAYISVLQYPSIHYVCIVVYEYIVVCILWYVCILSYVCILWYVYCGICLYCGMYVYCSMCIVVDVCIVVYMYIVVCVLSGLWYYETELFHELRIFAIKSLANIVNVHLLLTSLYITTAEPRTLKL